MKQLLETMLDGYENGRVSRRHFIQGLVALGVGGTAACEVLAGSAPEPLFTTRTINHVTIYVSDVARSKAFYQRLTGLPIRDEAKDFCEFRLDGGFLGLYAPELQDAPALITSASGSKSMMPSGSMRSSPKWLPKVIQVSRTKIRFTCAIPMVCACSSRTSLTSVEKRLTRRSS